MIEHTKSAHTSCVFIAKSWEPSRESLLLWKIEIACIDLIRGKRVQKRDDSRYVYVFFFCFFARPTSCCTSVSIFPLFPLYGKYGNCKNKKQRIMWCLLTGWYVHATPIISNDYIRWIGAIETLVR